METTASNPTGASATLLASIAAVRALEVPAVHEPRRAAALEVAQILLTLEADEEVILASLMQPLIEVKVLSREQAERRFGAEAVRLARELTGLGNFGLPPGWTPQQGLEPTQAEALRKMLLAIVGDVRLVIVRLAAQLQRLRAVKAEEAPVQRRAALEAREVYAPLANRLGVWQLKWELEDFAFRYLQPAEYKRIAIALNSRRSEREQYIAALKSELQSELAKAGIAARVEGRPKHIYSIWRKMQVKGLAFEQLRDLIAARILVPSVADCYAALGVVHSLWQFIAGEFDDYIATPKDNLYRSIHTAVLGPGGQTVEIQIRTHEMHANSERGVAAHWRYKEGGRTDHAYERKINQLRALLTPLEGDEAAQDFLERMRVDLFQDRIYALSPKGEIVDVPVGGTPLDFAYQVHTELGHRTRGAKVNGRIVSLDYRLKNGETVEIIPAKEARPSRDWLAAQSGFLASPRNRNKVRAWFRKQNTADTKSEGRSMFEHEMQRLGVTSPPLAELLGELKLGGSEALFEALGLGELSPAQLAGALQRVQRTRTPPPPASRRTQGASGPGAQVEGVGDWLTTFAKCCRPVPPEPIVGYITIGKGVSIHAQSCANLRRIGARSPSRVLELSWGTLGRREFAVDIDVEAFDRRGLVRDVSATVADAKISIAGMSTVTDKRDGFAHMEMQILVSDLPELSMVLARIAQVANVISARRRK